MSTLLLLLPDLSLILAGYLLYRHVDWGDAFWVGVEKLVYYVLFPALLFHAIVHNRIDPGAAAPFVLGVAVVVAVGIALGYLGRLVVPVESRRFASAVQCAFRFNSYVALALSQRLGGEAGLALCAIVVAIAVPMCNVAAVWGLARHSEHGLVRELLRNPLLLATLAGLAGNLLGLELPDPVSAFLGRLGAAALALGLIAVGAGLRPSGAGGDRPFAVYATLVKLVAMPLAALLVGAALGLPPLARQVLVLFGAMPTASAAYILANRMGGDGAYVAWLITLSTLGSVLALPFWLSWVR
jgi:hypothetical protein